MIPRFRILTLLIVVACLSLLTWLNTLERTTISEPYYAPLMGAVGHPPPYQPKEMGVSVFIDHGWPTWHSRESMHVMYHNAALYIDDYGTPNAKPRAGGPFGLRDHSSHEKSYLGATVNISVALIVIAVVGLVSEMFIGRFGSARRPTRHGRRAESPSA